MNGRERKGEFTKLVLGALGALDFVEHAFTENGVGAGLVAFASLLQPRDDVGVEAHGDGLLHRTVEFAADGIFPGAEWELWNVGGVDLAIR
jgi:hypothetical protein